jgi:hypothetical protein
MWIWRGAPGAGGRWARRLVTGAAAIALALALGNFLATQSAPPGHGALRAGTTSLSFVPEILADLGLDLVDVAETSPPLREGALGFALDVPPSTVRLDAAGSDFEGFLAADLRHAGGFALQTQGARLDFSTFQLHETAAPHALELRDAQGTRWFVIDKPQAVLTADWLAIDNADVLIAPELAGLLGRPDLAGTYIGVFDAQLSLEPASPSALDATVAGGAACVGDFSQPADLHLTVLSGMTQSVREPGGRIAISPSATVQNLGPGDVQWYRAIAPASPVGPHAFLLLNFYRLSGGVLEQIGREDVKHAFFATNEICGCTPGHIFYAECQDVYGVNTNLDRLNLAPRSEVNALAASWTSLGSHFDGAPVDDYRDHGGNTEHDSFEHRLVVLEPDLETPDARYFYDGWYLAPNDPNLGNSMGYREVDPTFGGSTWTFPTIDAGTANGSILDVLVDPQNVQPGQASELLDTGEGRVHLVAVTTDLGGGSYHYEYALLNFDFERRVQSFSLPIGTGQIISNTGFDDGDNSAANDWTPSIASGSVTWTAPAGHALDFGTLFNFRFDANTAPVAGAATITPLDPGNPGAIPVRTLPEPGRGQSIGSSLILLTLLASHPRRRARR